MRAFAAAIVIAVLLSASAAPASADRSRPVVSACHVWDGASPLGACAPVREANGLWGIAIAPDGRTAYGVAFTAGTLLIFNRDPATGRLTQRGIGGCVRDAPTTCASGRALAVASDVKISPDGRHVYVSSYNGGIAIFERDEVSGDLTQRSGAAGCIADAGTAGCAQSRGLTGAMSLAISSDGRHVYAGSGGAAAAHRSPSWIAIRARAR